MEHTVRAGISAKKKQNGIIKLTVVATAAVVGVLMTVVSLVHGAYLFALLYAAAALLGGLYAVIKINSILPPCAEASSEMLYMTTWDNSFFPFNIDFRPAFLADFIPAKTITYEIPMSEIADMAIGTKGYLARALNNPVFDARMNELTRKNHRLDTLLKRCDILYVRLKNDDVYMMSVSDFDVNELYRLVDIVEHATRGLEFKTNLRLLRKKRETILGR